MVDLDRLSTETPNPRTHDLDSLPVEDLLRVMNDEDRRVPEVVGTVVPQIAAAVRAAAAAFRAGGRLIYLGAGTSGRLGVLDAAECPPTFGTDPAMVVGLIAGGDRALLKAVEGAEDSEELAVEDLQRIEVTAADAVVGLAASGRTPYVIGGLDHARRVGAATISVAGNSGAEISRHADISIEVDTGPEVLTGSTRLKAGTAQKLVLNMISTGAMVQVGKVHGNLMVDVRPTNAKLIDRARRIIRTATGCDADTAATALERADGHAKTAIVMILSDCSAQEAVRRLDASDGFVRAAVAR